MKRIILIKEYVLLLSILIIMVILALYFTKTTYGFSYFVALITNIFFIIEMFIRNMRLKANKMKAIKSNGIILLKCITIIFIFIVYILFIYFYFKNSNMDISSALVLSLGLNRTVLINRVYISNKSFVVGNKMYFLESLNEIIDDFGSNFNIIINDNKESVYCGSLIVKDKLINEIEILKDLV